MVHARSCAPAPLGAAGNCGSANVTITEMTITSGVAHFVMVVMATMVEAVIMVVVVMVMVMAAVGDGRRQIDKGQDDNGGANGQ
jgi:hypothetical protein